jgi:IS30 family transposase
MPIFAPRPKVTFMGHLTQEQRYTIYRMLQAKCTRKEICIATGKDKSVLSRELKRNKSKRGYSPVLAQQYTLTNEKSVSKSSASLLRVLSRK